MGLCTGLIGDKIRKQAESQCGGLQCHAEISQHSLVNNREPLEVIKGKSIMTKYHLFIPAHHPSLLSYELSPPAPDPLQV